MAQLNYRWKQLSKQNRGLSNEVDNILQKQENGDPLPPRISPQAKEWLQITNNGLFRDIGAMARAGGFKVVLPDRSTRPFIGAPPDAIPAPPIMRRDVAHVLDNPLHDDKGNLTPGAARLYNEGRAKINKSTGKPYFSKPADLEPWKRQYEMEQRLGPELTSLEKARLFCSPGKAVRSCRLLFTLSDGRLSTRGLSHPTRSPKNNSG